MKTKAVKTLKVKLGAEDDFNVELAFPDGRVFSLVRDFEFDGIAIFCLKRGKPLKQLVWMLNDCDKEVPVCVATEILVGVLNP